METQCRRHHEISEVSPIQDIVNVVSSLFDSVIVVHCKLVLTHEFNERSLRVQFGIFFEKKSQRSDIFHHMHVDDEFTDDQEAESV